MRFPRRALRDIDARYVRQTSCPSQVGVALLDFEPLSGGTPGYEFVNGLDPAETAGPRGDETAAYVAALDEGIRLCLAGVPFGDLGPGIAPPAAFSARLRTGFPVGGDAGAPVVAVRVTVRRIRVHELDSCVPAFRRAGWRGARTAVDIDLARTG